MKIKVKLNKTQYESLLFCTNGQDEIMVSDMINYFEPFLDAELRNKKYNSNDIFVFTM